MMSSARLVTRSMRYWQEAGLCIFCRSRQLGPYVVHNGAAKRSTRYNTRVRPYGVTRSTRAYATTPGQKLDVQRLRIDVDERARVGFYTLNKMQGALHMDPSKANSIAKEFLAKQKKMDHRSNIEHLASKYRVSIEDLSSLAIVTFKIPDLTDQAKKAILSPSQHKPLCGAMLQGCAQAEDPLAIIQILTAVYLTGSSEGSSYRDMASLFPQNEIAKYLRTLEKLGTKSKTFSLGPDALTLQGLFMEKEGKNDKAQALYTEAIERCHFKYNPKSKHPMQLPLPTPWNALGYLLKSDKDPKVQAQAKAYFMRGAVEGNDPLSYYELAAFEERKNPKWLQYTSKAAASGHRQATVDLADFYQEASSPDSAVLENSGMRKALNWLLGWKSGGAAALAREWLQAASNMGHKPSTLQLADYHESVGDQDGAKENYRKLTEPPSSTNQVEEWPQLVQVGRRRLAGIKT